MISASFYKWRAKYGGMDTSMMARLKELEAENRQLKKMYAEERLKAEIARSEEHTSELQSLMRNSYAGFCLKKKIKLPTCNNHDQKTQQNKHHLYQHTHETK